MSDNDNTDDLERHGGWGGGVEKKINISGTDKLFSDAIGIKFNFSTLRFSIVIIFHWLFEVSFLERLSDY